MLSHLADILTGVRRTTHPSALIVIGSPSKAELLHVVAETGEAERLGHYSSGATTFSYCGTKEKSREQIATIVMRGLDMKDYDQFLEDVGARAAKLLSDGDRTVNSLANALRSAVAEVMETRASRDARVGDQNIPVWLVHISRRKPGKILSEDQLTSFPRWELGQGSTKAARQHVMPRIMFAPAFV